MLIGISVLIFVFVVSYVIYKRGQAAKCPDCGKPFAMREVSRDKTPVSTCETTTNTGLFEMDLKGNYSTADLMRVPTTAYVHKCVDQCKFCGFQKEALRTQVPQK